MYHAQVRALQRYNKHLTTNDLYKICNLIKNNEHMVVGMVPNTDEKRIFCYVTYNNIPYKILYQIQDNKIKIITVYPFDTDEYNNLVAKKEQGGMEDYIVNEFMKIFEVNDD